MDLILDFAAFFLSMLSLVYSAYSDLKTREVTNNVWMIYLPSAITLLCLRLILTPAFILRSIVSILLVLSFSLVVFYLGLFGGADAKALICLGIALPWYPVFSNPILRSMNPFFPLAVLYNSYLFSLSVVIYVLIKNLGWKYAAGRSLFQNYENASLFTKMLALLTGYKTHFNDLRKTIYLYPMEEILQTDGQLSRRLKLSTLADTDRSGLVKALEDHLKNGDEVWVTPGIPLLFFVLMGLVSTTFIGDVLLWLVIRVVSTITG